MTKKSIFNLLSKCFLTLLFAFLLINQTYAYGGGGGRGGASVGKCGGTNTPEFYDIYPLKNSSVQTLSKIEFSVTGQKLDAEALTVEVRQKNIDLQISEKENGDLIAEGNISPPITTEGSVHVSLKSINTLDCQKNITYFVNVSKTATGAGTSTDANDGVDGTGSGVESVFKDITGHWAAYYIATLQSLSIVKGDADTGYFRPNDKTNRAEMLAMSFRAFNIDFPSSVSSKPYPDVKTNHWFAGYVTKAKELKWIEGYKDGEFKPSRNVTRAEALKMLMQIAGIDTSGSKANNRFSDVPNNKWFTPYINWATNNGIVNGYKDGTFRPNEPISRAEMCKLIVKLMETTGWL